MGMARPAVVLVNCARGGELDVVRDALTGWLDTPTLLIGHADLACLPIWLDVRTGVLDVGGRAVWPAVLWVRHASASAIACQVAGLTPLDAAAWSGFFRDVATSADAVLPGNPGPPATAGQLRDAERAGVRTPRTVLTTDSRAGRELLGLAGRVMVKTPDFRLHEPDPRNWLTILDAGQAEGTAARPVVVQEYVAHASELRVYYLNGGICAFQVRKPTPASLWTDPASVTVTRTDCPASAADAVRTLCAAWDLRYGAFDLLVSPAGEPVFLEVNPDGDWLWYERKARWHGVSFMAAVMVRELFVRVAS
jgi:hypothetical protein